MEPLDYLLEFVLREEEGVAEEVLENSLVEPRLVELGILGDQSSV